MADAFCLNSLAEKRERVIHGLKCCRQSGAHEGCPYYSEIGKTCTTSLLEDALSLLEGQAVWVYYTNDEGRARWKCSKCGKIVKRNPHDKRFCSNCGRPIIMES